MGAGDEEKVLLGTETGEVLIIFNGDLRGNVSVDPDMAIRALVPTSKARLCPCTSYASHWMQWSTQHASMSVLSSLTLCKNLCQALNLQTWVSSDWTSTVIETRQRAQCLITTTGYQCVVMGKELTVALQGFAAGCSNGSVSIFEREADSRLFRRVWQATVEGLAPSITSMTLTPSEDALFLTTAGRQMLKRKLTGSPQVQLCLS